MKEKRKRCFRNESYGSDVLRLLPADAAVVASATEPFVTPVREPGAGPAALATRVHGGTSQLNPRRET